MNELKLSYDEFWQTFSPIKNPIDSNASEDGCMFETYGNELAFVLAVSKASPRKVWTVMEDDNGDICIGDGFHHVNRLGYLITEVAAEDDVSYYVEG